MSTSSLESVEEADARMWRDKAFARTSRRRAVLLHFERAQEWADLIADLLKLQRVLNKYPQFNVVPDKVLVAKRSTSASTRRCPPASTRRSRRSSSSSRGSASSGWRATSRSTRSIFPLYRYAAFQVKPVLLDLFERHYVPLGPRIVPCLPGLVPPPPRDGRRRRRPAEPARPLAARRSRVVHADRRLHGRRLGLPAAQLGRAAAGAPPITTRFPTPGADADDGSGGLGETSKGVATTSSARLAVLRSFSARRRGHHPPLLGGGAAAETRSSAAPLELSSTFPLPAPEGAASAAHRRCRRRRRRRRRRPGRRPRRRRRRGLFDASGESPIKSGLAAADMLFGRGGSAIFGAPSDAPAAAAAAAPPPPPKSLFGAEGSTALLAAALQLLPQRGGRSPGGSCSGSLGRRRRRGLRGLPAAAAARAPLLPRRRCPPHRRRCRAAARATRGRGSCSFALRQ